MNKVLTANATVTTNYQTVWTLGNLSTNEISVAVTQQTPIAWLQKGN